MYRIIIDLISISLQNHMSKLYLCLFGDICDKHVMISDGYFKLVNRLLGQNDGIPLRKK